MPTNLSQWSQVLISIWPWSRINELTMEVLRQRGIACKVREERDWFQMALAQTWEANATEYNNRWRERAEFFEANATEHNRSRRGWKWLYEQKCEQWEREITSARLMGDALDADFDIMQTMRKELTEVRGLRDGWEQTARELGSQVQQGDHNLQRVEAERDALHQQLEVKEATIERLEATLKDAQRNDQRDSRGRFTSR